jgi:hypothetical protein
MKLEPHPCMARMNQPSATVAYMNAKDPRPSQELHSWEALAPVFADLNKYAATMHFVGQSTILNLTADQGTGEATDWRITLPRRWKATADDRRAALLRHVCKDG